MAQIEKYRWNGTLVDIMFAQTQTRNQKSYSNFKALYLWLKPPTQPPPPLNTKPQILNPKLPAPNLKHQTPNYQHNPSTQYPKFQTDAYLPNFLFVPLFPAENSLCQFYLRANFNPIVYSTCVLMH